MTAILLLVVDSRCSCCFDEWWHHGKRRL